MELGIRLASPVYQIPVFRMTNPVPGFRRQGVRCTVHFLVYDLRLSICGLWVLLSGFTISELRIPLSDSVFWILSPTYDFRVPNSGVDDHFQVSRVQVLISSFRVSMRLNIIFSFPTPDYDFRIIRSDFPTSELRLPNPILQLPASDFLNSNFTTSNLRLPGT